MVPLGLMVQPGTSWKPFSFRFKWAYRFFEALSQVGSYIPIGPQWQNLNQQVMKLHIMAYCA